MVQARILTKEYDQAGSDLALLEAIGNSTSTHLIVVILRSIYNREADPSAIFDVDSLLAAMNQHLDQISSYSAQLSSRSINTPVYSMDLYSEKFNNLDLSTFSAAISECLKYCTTLEQTVADPKNGQVCDLITHMIENVPGIIPFSCYLAVLAFGEGRYVQATKAIQSVLNSHWGFNPPQCHLLLARIRLQMKQFEDSESSLNRAVSNNFEIRNTLRYQMISAQLQDAKGEYEKATETIQSLKKSIEYRNALLTEKVNVNLFLSRSLRWQGKNNESIQVLDETLAQWGETPKRDKILLFKASLLSKVDRSYDGLAILDQFQSHSVYFSRARKKAAKIYLSKLNDKASFIKCFKQLASEVPAKGNFILLGEAYMKVKKFDDSVEAFKNAAHVDSNDYQVAIHCARSLMAVHRFDEALDAYRQASSISGHNAKASLEYASALFKLRKYEQAKESILERLQ
jgi:tetratricopeptide repeat protein 21B